MSLWICVCWKVWRAQKAKRKDADVKRRNPSGHNCCHNTSLCAVKKQGRDAELWIGTQCQYTSAQTLPHHPAHPQAPFLVAMEGMSRHRAFPKVSIKCPSRES